MLRQDQDGFWPLTGKEYTAFLRICAAESALLECEDVLKERLKLRPNLYRDYRMITKRISSLTSLILSTVPLKKLFQIQRETRNVKVFLQIGPDADNRKKNQVIYVDEQAFINLLDQVVGMNCLLCDKHGKEVKRCPWLKIIEDVMPYSPDPALDPADGTCQLAGRSYIVEED
jgi:hypothetical protein